MEKERNDNVPKSIIKTCILSVLFFKSDFSDFFFAFIFRILFTYMKIAVIVYGEYREFEFVVKSWDFLEKLNCDVFISTWDKSIQINQELNIHVDEDITEERILNILPNAKVSVLKESDYFDLTIADAHSQARNTNKMIFHMKNGLKLVNDSGIQYDMILLMRPDCYQNYPILEPEYFYSHNQKDRIYGVSYINVTGKDSYFLSDILFVGDFGVMTDFISTLPEDLLGNVHTNLAKHIISRDLWVDRFHTFDVTVCRANVRELIGTHYTTTDLLNKLRLYDQTSKNLFLTKQKYAVFVYGQFRQLDVVVKSWKFLNELDCDVYVSTWDKSYKKAIHQPHNVSIDVNKEMIQNLLPNSTVVIGNEAQHNINVYQNNDPYFWSIIANSEKTIYHWKTCLKSLKESGKQYDKIILIRTDDYMFFYMKPTEMNRFNIHQTIFKHGGRENRGIFLNESNQHTVNDIFFFGSYELMSDMIQTLPDKIDKVLHDALGDHLVSKNIKVEPVYEIDAYVVRENIRTLNESEITIENIDKKMIEWG